MSPVLVSTTAGCGGNFCSSVCAAVSTAVWAPLVEVGCGSAWTLHLELQRCAADLFFFFNEDDTVNFVASISFLLKYLVIHV